MIAVLRTFLGKADGIPEKGLLWTNAGLACFIAFAHGGALAITYSKPTPDAEDIRQLAMFSLPMAAVVIATAVVALIRVDLRRWVLGVHGFVLASSAAAGLFWASSILLVGMPAGNFRWTVGWLSAWVTYSVFVLCRFSLPPRLRAHPAVFYAPVIALVVAATVDISVLLRLAGDIGVHRGH